MKNVGCLVNLLGGAVSIVSIICASIGTTMSIVFARKKV